MTDSISQLLGNNQYQLTTQPGAFNFGVSPFDQSMIDQATTSNVQAVDNRYNQLGLQGSTMEGQDVAGAGQMGSAMTGELQTANEGSAALNPAIQQPVNNIIGTNTSGQTLSDLAKALGTASKAL